MRASVRRDLTRSADEFSRLVWPAVAPFLGGDSFITLEDANAQGLASLLDKHAGIDGYALHPLGYLRGIACRVQPTDRPWDTFTIRHSRASGAETEYSKRWFAIETFDDFGITYPTFTVQGYVSTDGQRLLTAAIIRTRDLFIFVDSRLGASCPEIQIKQVGVDGNTFISVPWAALRDAGLAIRTHAAPELLRRPA